METIDYRLTAIEKSVGELKDLLVESKLQSKDIQSLSKKQEEFDKTIAEHDKRITSLENRSDKTKAVWVDKAFDIVFKVILTALAGILIVKLGIK